MRSTISWQSVALVFLATYHARAFVAPVANAVAPGSPPRHLRNRVSSDRPSVSPSSTAVPDLLERVAGQEVLDVAIVGAGPAGLALAVGLKGKGLRVKVYEAAPEIKERGAAFFLQVRGFGKKDCWLFIHICFYLLHSMI